MFLQLATLRFMPYLFASHDMVSFGSTAEVVDDVLNDIDGGEGCGRVVEVARDSSKKLAASVSDMILEWISIHV